MENDSLYPAKSLPLQSGPTRKRAVRRALGTAAPFVPVAERLAQPEPFLSPGSQAARTLDDLLARRPELAGLLADARAARAKILARNLGWTRTSAALEFVWFSTREGFRVAVRRAFGAQLSTGEQAALTGQDAVDLANAEAFVLDCLRGRGLWWVAPPRPRAEDEDNGPLYGSRPVYSTGATLRQRRHRATTRKRPRRSRVSRMKES